MSLFSVSFITILVIVLVLLVGSIILTYRKSEEINSKVVTKGLNGLQGQTLNLVCPSGQSISFKNKNQSNVYRVALVCGDVPNTTNPKPCDSFAGGTSDQSQSFYNSNSIDIINTSTFNLKDLQGKNSGTFVVPDASDPRVNKVGCLGSCKQIQVVGTYDCM